MNRAHQGLRIALISAALSSATLAQPSAKPDDALRGPAVHDRAVPGTVGNFAGTPETGKFRPREARPAVFLDALTKALGPDAPEHLRASPEQMKQIHALGDEFRARVREHLAQNHDQVRKLRESVGKARQRRAEGDAMSDDKPSREGPSEETLAAGRALRDSMPSPSDLYTKVWDILSAQQRAAVEARLEARQHEQAVKEGREYVQRRLQKAQPVPGQPEGLAKDKGKFAPGRALQPGTPGDGLPPEFRERLMKALQRLSPEERENLLNRLEQRLRDREGAGDPPRQRPARAPRQRPQPAPE